LQKTAVGVLNTCF